MGMLLLQKWMAAVAAQDGCHREQDRKRHGDHGRPWLAVDGVRTDRESLHLHFFFFWRGVREWRLQSRRPEGWKSDLAGPAVFLTSYGLYIFNFFFSQLAMDMR